VSDRLLTARELGDYLGLSPASVLRRWRAGEIPGFVLSANVVRFDRAEIDRWLASRRRWTDTATPSRPLHSVDQEGDSDAC
jgi:predicted DNA-binding transcriptional regulator AlpA